MPRHRVMRTFSKSKDSSFHATEVLAAFTTTMIHLACAAVCTWKKKKKKRKSGFSQRLGDLDDSMDLLDYLLDDSNFSLDQKVPGEKM